MEPRDLARDTAVTKLAAAPGWYTAELSNAWDFRTPSGGALMTVAMRAMEEGLSDPELRPLSAHTHFRSPLPAGPLEDTTSQWLLTCAHARRARAGYATADVEIWDDRGRRVAFATQMMLLRRIAGSLPAQE